MLGDNRWGLIGALTATCHVSGSVRSITVQLKAEGAGQGGWGVGGVGGVGGHPLLRPHKDNAAEIF